MTPTKKDLKSIRYTHNKTIFFVPNPFMLSALFYHPLKDSLHQKYKVHNSNVDVLTLYIKQRLTVMKIVVLEDLFSFNVEWILVVCYCIPRVGRLNKKKGNILQF